MVCSGCFDGQEEKKLEALTHYNERKQQQQVELAKLYREPRGTGVACPRCDKELTFPPLGQVKYRDALHRTPPAHPTETASCDMCGFKTELVL